MCPIGVGEIAQGIVGKAVLTGVRGYIPHAACPSQHCAGQTAGLEAAIHAVGEQ